MSAVPDDPPGVNPRQIVIKTVNGDVHQLDFDYLDKGTWLAVTSDELWKVPEEERSSVLEEKRMAALRESIEDGLGTWRIAGFDAYVASRHIVKAWFLPNDGGFRVLTPLMPGQNEMG